MLPLCPFYIRFLWSNSIWYAFFYLFHVSSSYCDLMTLSRNNKYRVSRCCFYHVSSPTLEWSIYHTVFQNSSGHITITGQPDWDLWPIKTWRFHLCYYTSVRTGGADTHSVIPSIDYFTADTEVYSYVFSHDIYSSSTSLSCFIHLFMTIVIYCK